MLFRRTFPLVVLERVLGGRMYTPATATPAVPATAARIRPGSSAGHRAGSRASAISSTPSGWPGSLGACGWSRSEKVSEPPKVSALVPVCQMPQVHQMTSDCFAKTPQGFTKGTKLDAQTAQKLLQSAQVKLTHRLIRNCH